MRCALIHALDFAELRVSAAAFCQIVVAALLGDPAFFEHDDFICFAYCGEPMRDDDQRARARDAVDRAASVPSESVGGAREFQRRARMAGVLSHGCEQMTIV